MEDMLQTHNKWCICWTQNIKHILWPLQYQKLKFCFTFLWEGLSETIFTFFVSWFAQNVFVTESRCVHLKIYIILSDQLKLYKCYKKSQLLYYTTTPASKNREILFCKIIIRLSLDDHAISAKSRLSVLKDVIDLLYPICFYYDRIMDHIMTLRKPRWRRNIYADLNYILINFLPCLCILDYLVT